MTNQSKFIKFPIIKQLVFLLQKIKLPWLDGLSLFDLLDHYFVGIIEGALSYRARRRISKSNRRQL